MAGPIRRHAAIDWWVPSAPLRYARGALLNFNFALPDCAQKSVFRRETQSIARRIDSICDRPLRHPSGRQDPSLKVSNFAQTADVWSVNFPADGRVAQSAERVREQHETVVRNHSPAANSPNPGQSGLRAFTGPG